MRQTTALTILLVILFIQGCGSFPGYNSDDSPVTTTNISNPSAVPTGLSATSANQKITVSWNAAEGATSYNLYYGTSSSVTKESGSKISSVTSPYTLLDLTNGTPYYLVLTAGNSDGESDASSSVSATPEATWVRLSEGQNMCDTDGIMSAVAMSEAGDLYIICGYGGYEEHKWMEVRKWDGSSWVKMGDNIERADVVFPVWVNYGLIKLVIEDEVPWISWQEDHLLYDEGGGVGTYYKVVYWDGTNWVQKGEAIDSSTTGPNIVDVTLAVKNSIPYLAIEDLVTGSDEDIYVYYWNGSQWSTLGDRLDLAYGASPQMAFEGDTLYVAWVEIDITTNYMSLLVKYWDGSQWVQLGDGIKPSDGVISYLSGKLTLHDGIPYLVWRGTEGAHVSVWNKTDALWTTDAYTVERELYYGFLIFIGSTPYLVGYSTDYYMVAKYWDGNSWKEVNSEIGSNIAWQGAVSLSDGQTIYIFWVNSYDSDNIDNYVGYVP